MTKPNSPWSIKGVSAEARNAAKEGARISRQPLGGWLSQVIEKTSRAEAGDHDTANSFGGTGPENLVSSIASPSDAATWHEAVVRLEARIAESEARSAAAVESQTETLERIASRLDSMETYVLRQPRRSYLSRLLRR